MISIPPPAPIDDLTPWLRAIGERPVAVFKHSPACGTSRMALRAFQEFLQGAGADTPVDYFLVDVLNDRPLSQALAKATGVRHESPQVLLLKNGMCVWTTSHISINAQALQRQISKFLVKPSGA